MPDLKEDLCMAYDHDMTCAETRSPTAVILSEPSEFETPQSYATSYQTSSCDSLDLFFRPSSDQFDNPPISRFKPATTECENAGSYLSLLVMGMLIGLVFATLTWWSGLGAILSLVVYSAVGTASVLFSLLFIAFQSETEA